MLQMVRKMGKVYLMNPKSKGIRKKELIEVVKHIQKTKRTNKKTEIFVPAGVVKGLHSSYMGYLEPEIMEGKPYIRNG